MRSVALDYDTRRLVRRQAPEPGAIGPREALFRVHQAGICGTDRDLARFRYGYPPEGESCLILGHEALGQVVESGSEAGGLARGDWVVPMIRRACAPACASCARGRRDLCLTDGYWSAASSARTATSATGPWTTPRIWSKCRRAWSSTRF